MTGYDDEMINKCEQLLIKQIKINIVQIKENGRNTLQIHLCMIVEYEFWSILKHVIITTVNIDLIYLMKWKTSHLC